MKTFLLENWGTIIFILALLFLILSIIFIEPKLPKKEDNHKQFKMK